MTDPKEQVLYERMVNDAMQAFGYGRTKAEALAKKMIVRFRKLGHFQEPGSPSKVPGKKNKARNAKGPRGPLTREEIARLPPVNPPRPLPRNAKERMERALGPDEGEPRRRGGSPVVQGGSPGLGKRR